MNRFKIFDSNMILGFLFGVIFASGFINYLEDHYCEELNNVTKNIFS